MVLTMKQLTTNESVSDKWQCSPLKRSGNHSSKLTTAESLKARKRFLMVITPA